MTKNLSSPSRKNISLSIRPKSVAPSLLSRLDKRGGSRVVTNARRDVVDAAASGAKRVRRAGSPVSGHGAQDDRRCSVRQSRVVLTPVAGAKLSVAKLIRPDRSAIKPAAMEARRIRLQGERGISRQTIAQGMPACSGCTCMLVCALICIHCTRDRGCSKHPAFPAPSVLGEGFLLASLGRNLRRENANAHSAVIVRLVRDCAMGRTIQYSRGSSD
jgi:hypothetical protein